MQRARSTLIAALVLFAGCRPAQEPPKTAVIQIGQDLDRTGSLATPSWSESVRLAIGTANQALKLAGRTDLRFDVVAANSGNSPDVARASATELVRKGGARAILTDSSQDDIAINMLAYGDPAESLEVPIVCMACTSPEINDPAATDADPVKQEALRNSKHWNFRTTVSDKYQERMLIRMLLLSGKNGDVNRDGLFKLSIYASDDAFGRAYSNKLKTLAQGYRPDAAVEQIYVGKQVDPSTYDWAADVRKLIDNKNEGSGKIDGVPDAVIENTFPKLSIGFTRAWLAAGSKIRLVHAHNFRTARVVEALREAVEGQEGVSQAVLGEGPSAATFAKDLRAATGQGPAFRDSTAYDAANSIVLATLVAVQSEKLADPANVTGAQLRDALGRINLRAGEPVFAGIEGMARAVRLIQEGRAINYEGASGPCDFDANGDIVAQLARFRIEDKAFVDVERFDCIRDKDCPPMQPSTANVR
jgi:ABC-type branched-subunit amino acid transport system substrate-binding protein